VFLIGINMLLGEFKRWIDQTGLSKHVFWSVVRRAGLPFRSDILRGDDEDPVPDPLSYLVLNLLHVASMALEEPLPARALNRINMMRGRLSTHANHRAAVLICYFGEASDAELAELTKDPNP
jgi:hypothetical protein